MKKVDCKERATFAELGALWRSAFDLKCQGWEEATMKKQLGRDCDGHSKWPMLENTFECVEGRSAEASQRERAGKVGLRRTSGCLRALSSRVITHSQLIFLFGFSQILNPTARCRLHPYSCVSFRFNLFTHADLWATVMLAVFCCGLWGRQEKGQNTKESGCERDWAFDCVLLPARAALPDALTFKNFLGSSIV